jgi:hypothetical protein
MRPEPAASCTAHSNGDLASVDSPTLIIAIWMKPFLRGRTSTREQNSKLMISRMALRDQFLDSVYTLPDLFLQFTAEAFECPRSDMPSSIKFVGPIPPGASADFHQPHCLDGRRHQSRNIASIA